MSDKYVAPTPGESRMGDEFPQPSAAAIREHAEPDADAPRLGVKLPPNLAENEELCAKVLGFLQQKCNAFLTQDERDELEDRIESADAMDRMTMKRAPTVKGGAKKTQKQDNLDNSVSTVFHEVLNIYANAVNSMLFPADGALPVRFEPVPEAEEYTTVEGERVSEGRTRYLGRCWQSMNWTPLLKKSTRRCFRNGFEVATVGWNVTVERKTVRAPGYYDKGGAPYEVLPGTSELPAEMFDGAGRQIQYVFDPETGRPRSYVFIEKQVMTKNGPELEFHEIRNTYCDLSIADPQQQSCWTFLSQKTLDALMDQQRAGYYLNVEKVGRSQLYQGEGSHGSDMKNEQDDNAGYTTADRENGLYDTSHHFVRLPIKDADDPDKAKWDDGAVPQVFEVVVAGNIFAGGAMTTEKDKKAGGCVTLQLRRNPYNHGRMPVFVPRSHDDDRGMLGMSFPTLLECLWEEATITLRQHIDNKTLLVKAPFVGYNAAGLPRNLKFREGNQVFWSSIMPVDQVLKKIDVQDITKDTVPFLDWLRQQMFNLLHINDAFLGVFAGSRTTAGEYYGALQQSLKPILEIGRRMADEYFIPLATFVDDLRDQFATDWDLGDGLAANELYGPKQVKVVSVEHFERSIAAKQAYNNMIASGAYDRARADGAIGDNGKLKFWRAFGRAMDIPDAEDVFDGVRSVSEAEQNAMGDVAAIMADPMAAIQDDARLPRPEEMHDVHIPILRRQKMRVQAHMQTLPDGAQIEGGGDAAQYFATVAAALEYYIQLHEDYKAQADLAARAQAGAMAQAQAGMGGPQTAQAAMQAVPNQSAQTPGMEGEAAGDALAGLTGGGMA